MGHGIEAASSGRAKCRGCGKAIAKGELRLGERLPNPWSDKTPLTLWFHLPCAAYKRPAVLLDVLAAHSGDVPGRETFVAAAERGVAHRRLPRVDGAERASTGRARCRACRERIAKGGWRVSLVYYQEGQFEPSGYVHAGCAKEYFGTADVVDRARHFSPDLTDAEASELAAALGVSS